jgi:nickel-type superoxide dismutase maturation protease
MRRPLSALLTLLRPLVCMARVILPRFVVSDTSMRPALEPGDRLVIGRWLRPRKGDIVVAQDPEQPSIILVKRVASLTRNGGLVLHADNPNVSRDSRHFGPVPRRLIVGRVIYRYLPGERRGWVASRQ